MGPSVYHVAPSSCLPATDRSRSQKQTLAGTPPRTATGREHHFVLAADSGLSNDFLITSRMTAVRAHTKLTLSPMGRLSVTLQIANVEVLIRLRG